MAVVFEKKNLSLGMKQIDFLYNLLFLCINWKPINSWSQRFD